MLTNSNGAASHKSGLSRLRGGAMRSSACPHVLAPGDVPAREPGARVPPNGEPATPGDSVFRQDKEVIGKIQAWPRTRPRSERISINRPPDRGRASAVFTARSRRRLDRGTRWPGPELTRPPATGLAAGQPGLMRAYPRKPCSVFTFQYVSDGSLAKPLAEITNMTNNFPRFAELLVMKSTSGEEWI